MLEESVLVCLRRGVPAIRARARLDRIEHLRGGFAGDATVHRVDPVPKRNPGSTMIPLTRTAESRSTAPPYTSAPAGGTRQRHRIFVHPWLARKPRGSQTRTAAPPHPK